METIRTFTASTEAEMWQQVAADMQREEWFEYQAILNQGEYQVRLSIDIDLGGGFEGGSESMSLTAHLPRPTSFRFALHEQDWVHELGKMLGLTDVELGDPQIDEAFIITTNQPTALHDLLADSELRQILLRYPTARLVLSPPSDNPDGEAVLEFSQDVVPDEPAQLQEIYHLLLVLFQRISAITPTV